MYQRDPTCAVAALPRSSLFTQHLDDSAFPQGCWLMPELCESFSYEVQYCPFFLKRKGATLLNTYIYYHILIQSYTFFAFSYIFPYLTFNTFSESRQVRPVENCRSSVGHNLREQAKEHVFLCQFAPMDAQASPSKSQVPLRDTHASLASLGSSMAVVPTRRDRKVQVPRFNSFTVVRVIFVFRCLQAVCFQWWRSTFGPPLFPSKVLQSNLLSCWSHSQNQSPWSQSGQ